LVLVPKLRYADEQPDLAAAALSHAAETLESLEDAKGASRLREELLNRFPQTPHAATIKQQAKSTDEATQ